MVVMVLIGFLLLNGCAKRVWYAMFRGRLKIEEFSSCIPFYCLNYETL